MTFKFTKKLLSGIVAAKTKLDPQKQFAVALKREEEETPFGDLHVIQEDGVKTIILEQMDECNDPLSSVVLTEEQQYQFYYFLERRLFLGKKKEIKK